MIIKSPTFRPTWRYALAVFLFCAIPAWHACVAQFVPIQHLPISLSLVELQAEDNSGSLTSELKSPSIVNTIVNGDGLFEEFVFENIWDGHDSVAISECFGRDCVQIRSQDEVWVVDARGCHCNAPGLSSVRVRRHELGATGGRWQPSTLGELTMEHLVHQEMKTVLYVHGNQTNERWSIARGMRLYENVFGCGSAAPIRFVIVQWKSERERSNPVRDFIVKSRRAVEVGKTFAMILREFQDRELTIMGYSLGVQVVISAFGQPVMHEIHGGNGYRVAFIAPVFDCEFLDTVNNYPACGCYVEKTQVFLSQIDRVIKLSGRVCRRRTGNRCLSIENLVHRGAISLGMVENFEVSSETGKRHSIVQYSQSLTVKRAINDLVAMGVGQLTSESVLNSTDEEFDGAPDIPPTTDSKVQ